MSEAAPETPPVEPPATPPPAPPAEPPAASSQWDMIAGSLNESLSGEKYLEQFKGHDDAIEKLVVDAVTQNRLIGSEDRIARPKADAGDAEWDKFYTKLGRPETVEGYDLGDWKPTEGVPWDEGVQSTMTEALFKVGCTNDQVKGAIAAYESMNASMWNSGMETVTAQRAEADKQLRTDWGATYDDRKALAGQVIRSADQDTVAVLEHLELKDGTLFGDHPAALKLFATLGEKMSEDAFKGGEGPASLGLTPASAEAKIKELEENRNFMKDWGTKGSDNYAENRRQLKQLYEIAYPPGS